MSRAGLVINNQIIFSVTFEADSSYIRERIPLGVI